MASKNERKAELIALAEKQKSELIEQFKSLAKIMPNSEEARAVQRELAELEKTEQDIANEEAGERWNSSSISAARKKLSLVCQSLKCDVLFLNHSLFITGLIKQAIDNANLCISRNDKNYYNKHFEVGKYITKQIEKEKKDLINDNILKNEINKTWVENGLSSVTDDQWSRSLVLWAASKKYKDIELDFFRYIPKKYYDIPYMFRNLIKSNFEQKEKIVKYIPETFTEEQKNLINTVIQEVEMLFEVISLDDESKKITLSIKEKNNETIYITQYQFLRIKKEVGERYKVYDKNRNEYRVSVTKKTKLH